MLTFISGFLVFSSALDQEFKALIIKKSKTILIPLILFNIPVAVAVYVAQSYDALGHSFSKQMFPFDLYVWINAITGLLGETINYPLSFLRDLFVISLLAPIFGFLLRKSPWLGFLLIFSIFWNNFDASLVLRNVMPINFYMGGMAAVLGWNLHSLDRFGPLLATLFIVICFAIVLIPIENRNYLRLVSPIMLWPMAAILVGSKFGSFLSRLSKYSFAIFLSHGPLLLLAWLIYQEFLDFLPYPVFWLVVPVVIIVLVVQIYPLAYRCFPRATAIALGSR